jgi:hypothetical protein
MIDLTKSIDVTKLHTRANEAEKKLKELAHWVLVYDKFETWTSKEKMIEIAREVVSDDNQPD